MIRQPIGVHDIHINTHGADVSAELMDTELGYCAEHGRVLQGKWAVLWEDGGEKWGATVIACYEPPHVAPFSEQRCASTGAWLYALM